MRDEQAFGTMPGEHFDADAKFETDGSRLRADQMRQVASSLFHKLSESVEAMIHDQKAAGATIVADVARAGFHAADDLEASTPDAARALRKASAGIDRVAKNLREETLGQLFGSLREFGRLQPLAFVSGAVVGGFLIARSVRSGKLTSVLQGAAARSSTLVPAKEVR